MPVKDAWRAQTKPVCTRTQRPHRDWSRSAFECLSISCHGSCQQWPATGTGTLAAAGLGGPACGVSSLGEGASSPTIVLPSRRPINCRTSIPKKFSHSYEIFRTHNRFTNLGILQRDWEHPGNLTPEANGMWLQYFHRTGKQSLGGHRQNLVATRTQEKGAVTPLETARLACECPGVSNGGMGLQWPAVGLGALNTMVLA